VSCGVCAGGVTVAVPGVANSERISKPCAVAGATAIGVSPNTSANAAANSAALPRNLGDRLTRLIKLLFIGPLVRPLRIDSLVVML
jgi:hypothetical protein